MGQVPGSSRRSANLSQTKVNVNTATTTELIPATADQVGRLYSLALASAGTVTVQFKDGTTALTGALTLVAGIPFVLEYRGDPWFTTSTNTALNLVTGGAVQVSGATNWALSGGAAPSPPPPPPPPPPSASIAFESTQFSSAGVGGGNSYTLSLTGAAAAGAERLVALALIGGAADTDFASATIDGQTATKVGVSSVGATSSPTVVSFWRAPGTASTTFNVVATLGAHGAASAYCGLWTMTNAGTLAASTNWTTTGDATLDTNTVANGCAAAAALGYDLSVPRTTAWTGLTESFDGVTGFGSDIFTGACDNIAAGSTPLAISADYSSNPNSSTAAMCVSFNPA